MGYANLSKKKPENHTENFLMKSVLNIPNSYNSFIKALKNDNSCISALKDPDTENLVTDSQQKAEILRIGFFMLFFSL